MRITGPSDAAAKFDEIVAYFLSIGMGDADVYRRLAVALRRAAS